MKFAEIHCHSIYSNLCFTYGVESIATPEDLLREAKRKGLSALAITDHNNMVGSVEAQKLAKKYGIVVIPGEEFDTKRIMGQILGFGIKPGIIPNRHPLEIIKDIHACSGIAIIPHARDPFCGMWKIKEIINHVDGIEVINYATFSNKMSLRYAKRNNIKVRTGGSDAHTLSLIGTVVMGFPDSCKTVADYLACIKKGIFEIRINRKHLNALAIGGAHAVYTRALGLLRYRYFKEFRRKNQKYLEAAD